MFNEIEFPTKTNKRGTQMQPSTAAIFYRNLKQKNCEEKVNCSKWIRNNSNSDTSVNECVSELVGAESIQSVEHSTL